MESLACGSSDNAVHDVSWAPNMGRSYHLIAVACKDKSVCSKGYKKEKVVGNKEKRGERAN